jgi:hypothetical protein
MTNPKPEPRPCPSCGVDISAGYPHEAGIPEPRPQCDNCKAGDHKHCTNKELPPSWYCCCGVAAGTPETPHEHLIVGTERAGHCVYCDARFTGKNVQYVKLGTMTAEQLRERVLELIKGWLQNPKVQGDETAALALNALAGDIQVIDLEEK